MNINHYLHELEVRSGIKKIIWLILTLLVLSNGMLTLVVFAKKNTTQTILVPPQINRPIAISNTTISREYLEEMALFHLQLLFNTTPSTVEAQHGVLLKYIAPEYFKSLQNQLLRSQRYVKDNNLSTWFVPAKITGDSSSSSVEIEGGFMVAEGDKIVEKTPRKFIVNYKNQNAKVWLTSIKEEVKVNQHQSAKQKASVVEASVPEAIDNTPDAEPTKVIPYAAKS